MFIDQSKIYPFPKVTPIRLPRVISLAESFLKEEDFSLTAKQSIIRMKDLEQTFRDWFNPLADTSPFPYMYFMNNGITQALETMPVIFKNRDISMLQGDYFWLKTIKAAVEVNTRTMCDISYESCPSAVTGNVIDTTWDSKHHILDCAYVGTTNTKTIIPTNTDYLLLGFSKNIGMPELRLGLLLSKKPILTLEGLQKTFSHVGLNFFNIAAKICKSIPILELASELKEYQSKFCNLYPELLPSDSAILTTTDDVSYRFYKRPNGTIRVPVGESITYCIKNKLI